MWVHTLPVPTPPSTDEFDEGFLHFSKKEDDTYSVSLNETALYYDGMNYNATPEFAELTSFTIPATITHNGETYTVSEIEDNFFKQAATNIKAFGIEEGIKIINDIGANYSYNMSTWDSYLDGIASTEIPASVEEVKSLALHNFERVINSSNVDLTNSGAKYIIDSSVNYNFTTDANGNRFFYKIKDSVPADNTLAGLQVKNGTLIAIPSSIEYVNSLYDPIELGMSLNQSDVLDLGSNLVSISNDVSVGSYYGTPSIIYKGTTYDDAADATTLNALLVSDNLTTNATFWNYQITE